MLLTLNSLCKRPVAAILLVLLVGILAYANSFQVPFVLDDEVSISQNGLIRDLANYLDNSSGYELLPNRYVAYLTFALNFHFGGLEVSGYHVVNLAVHLATALLVYFLLRLTFRTPFFNFWKDTDKSIDPPSAFFSPGVFIPLFAALLFVAHPVQTQAVTYVVQRISSLAALFYLLSLVLYSKARLTLEEAGEKNQEGSLKPGWLKPGLLIAGSVIAAVLAMKTKEIAFTLPLAVFLYETCFFRGRWKHRLLLLLPLLATLPIIPLTVLGSGGAGDQILAGTEEQLRVQSGMPRLDYLLTQFRVIVTYLRLLIFPINQNLDYDYPVFTSFLDPQVYVSFFLLLVLFALALCLIYRSRFVTRESPKAASPLTRLIAFGIFWFFLTLSVESSLIPIVDVIQEHRLYLPGSGAAAAFSTFFWLLVEKFPKPVHRKLFVLGAILLVLVLGTATWQRNRVWGDAIRLWQDVVDKSPNKGRAVNNLGVALEAAGRREEAFRTLSRAIAVDPGYYRSYYNLADLYLVSDQPRTALPLLQETIRLSPDFSEAYISIGAALMRSGQFREMTNFLEQNRNHIEGYAEGHFYLGAGYVFQGDRNAALQELEIVSRLDKNFAASLAGMLGLKSGHGGMPRRQ